MALVPTYRASNSKVINAWIMYDWANSAFATTTMAVVLPVYFSTVAAKDALTPVQASSAWGFVQTIGMLLIALAAPVLGAIADYSGAKKRFLAAFAAPGILAAALMVFIGTGDWFLAAALYIVGEIGFSGSIIFYDALLPHITQPEEIHMVSARGYAMGYLGGGLLLALNLLMIQMPDPLGISALGRHFDIDGTEMAIRLSLMSVGIWWAVFSIPLLRHVPEPPCMRLQTENMENSIKGGFTRLIRTFNELRVYRQLLIFIAAFWIYNDGIGTIIKMAAIYGAEIGIGRTDLIGALLLTQFIGIPFALIFGRLPHKDDPRQTLFLSYVLYNALTIPLIGILAPHLNITSGFIAVAIALLNQGPAYLIARFIGRRLLAGLVQHLSTKNSILLALGVYCLVSVWGFFMATAVEFWLLAMMVGMVQGGAQALSRSLFGNMVPKAQTAEFFGFYDMSSKFAGLVGPLVFALVGQITGASRFSIFSLIVFFLAGGLILSRVNEQEGIRAARAVDAAIAGQRRVQDGL